eukprot:GHVN01079333.1.p1 GENE.GHVN01079333.1~~GHVN01079333.1.p1  ORF type:complete len:120 (+),score=21.85 GHVN01079333.1:77-436(+)
MEGLSVGLKTKRGHVVTKRELAPRPVSRQAKMQGRVRMIKEVIREVCGFAPYEKRIMELIRMGSISARKRALKFAKKRLGTHKRGMKKRNEMIETIAKQKKKASEQAEKDKHAEKTEKK